MNSTIKDNFYNLFDGVEFNPQNKDLETVKVGNIDVYVPESIKLQEFVVAAYSYGKEIGYDFFSEQNNDNSYTQIGAALDSQQYAIAFMAICTKLEVANVFSPKDKLSEISDEKNNKAMASGAIFLHVDTKKANLINPLILKES